MNKCLRAGFAAFVAAEVTRRRIGFGPGIPPRYLSGYNPGGCALSLLAALLLAATPAGVVRAGTIPIPNSSFESPQTVYVSLNIDSWQKSPRPDWYQESTNGGCCSWTQLTGIFKNTPPGSSDHIDNCDGNQSLWLFAVPEVGLFQDYDSTDWHNLPPNHQFEATFTPGKSYHLAVGVIGTGGGMAQGATLDLRLYYGDSATNHVIVAATTLTNDPSVFSNNTHLVDCRVDTTTVKPTDPWAGRHIGVEFRSTVDTNLQGGYWDLDNVRLIEGPVLLNPVYTNGQFTFTLLGEPNATFQILTTTNPLLPGSNWVNALTVQNTNGSTVVTTTVGSPAPAFFRVRQMP